MPLHVFTHFPTLFPPLSSFPPHLTLTIHEKMRNHFIFITAVLLFNNVFVDVAAQSPAPPARYIVKLKADAPHDEVLGFFQKASAFSASSTSASAKRNIIQDHFNDTWFPGFVGEFNDQLLSEFNQTHGQNVEYIIPDNPVKAYLLRQQRPPSWGLARLSFTSQVGRSNRDSYIYPNSAGQGVDVWVLDSGVYAEHPEFQGRAHRAASFVPHEDDRDLNGHGTHVAGTIAGITYGVAKKAQIYAVKVLDRNGDSWDSRIISGINYAIKQHKRKSGGGKLAVMNLSLGGGKSRAVDEAVRAAVNAGIVVVVAAGNEHMDACKLSPAGSADAFAVGAITMRDRIASFSNYGRCVRVYAPGDGIVSAGNNGGTRRMSGTSMASPHVAGIAALYIADRKYQAVQQVYQDLQRHSQAIPVNTNLPNFRIPAVVLSSAPIPAAVAPVTREEPEFVNPRPNNHRNRGHSISPVIESESELTPPSDIVVDDAELPNLPVLAPELDKEPLAPQNSTLAPQNGTLEPQNDNLAPQNDAILISNNTLPRDNSTTDELLTPVIPREVVIPDKGCKSGAFKCNGANFMKCDRDSWVKFSCAPGTICQTKDEFTILCDRPQQSDPEIRTPYLDEELPALLPEPIEPVGNDTVLTNPSDSIATNSTTTGNTTTNNNTTTTTIPINEPIPVVVEPKIPAPQPAPIVEKKPPPPASNDDGIHLPV